MINRSTSDIKFYSADKACLSGAILYLLYKPIYKAIYLPLANSQSIFANKNDENVYNLIHVSVFVMLLLIIGSNTFKRLYK